MASFLSFLTHHTELLLAFLSFLLLRLCLNHHPRLTVLNFPVLGVLPSLLIHSSRLQDWLTDILCSSNSSVLLSGPLFSKFDVLLTSDPENVRHVFTRNFLNYPKGETFADVFDLLGNGIFTADGEAWRFQRRLAHGLIANVGFRRFVSEMTSRKLEEGLFPLLRKFASTAEVFDLQDVFLRLTFDTTCMFVFGVDPRCLTGTTDGLPEVPFAKAMDDAEEVLFLRHVMPISWWKLVRWLRVGPERRMSEAIKVIDNFITESISKRTTEIEEVEVAIDSAEVRGDLLSSFLPSRHEVEHLGVDFTKFLRDTTLNFIVAGRDTTSSALTWFFFLTSRHPSVESKILDELSSSASDQSRLFYLHAALLESLRLFPPVPFENKGAASPDLLPSGHLVHPGRRILFSIYAMARMEGIWGKDCREFKPERWISESGKVRREPSYKFFSFNSGPRTCLGKDIAFVQMKVIAAAIFSRFKVVPTVVGPHAGVPKLSIILHMKGGFMVRVRERERPISGW